MSELTISGANATFLQVKCLVINLIKNFPHHHVPLGDIDLSTPLNIQSV